MAQQAPGDGNNARPTRIPNTLLRNERNSGRINHDINLPMAPSQETAIMTPFQKLRQCLIIPSLRQMVEEKDYVGIRGLIFLTMLTYAIIGSMITMECYRRGWLIP